MLDAVGKRSYADCRGLLKPGGVYLPAEVGKYFQNRHLHRRQAGICRLRIELVYIIVYNVSLGLNWSKLVR